MKLHKTITLEQEIYQLLENHNCNHSKLIQDLLVDYFNSQTQETNPKIDEKQLEEEKKEIDNKIKLLTKTKELKKKMKEAGLTEDKLKFLNSMSTSIMRAKDMTFAWERKFKQKINWSELLKLKREWITE